MAGLFAENIKFEVKGGEKRYNQIRIVNNTRYTDFNCTAYLLDKREDKFIANSSLGAFHFTNGKNSDSNTYLHMIRRGSYVGVKLPDQYKDLSWVVSYKDYPGFDTIEIDIFDEESPLGKEF